jgi:hypothetical protein
MKKVKALRDEESTRGVAAFDVVKPEGWTAPDLSDLVLPKKPEPPTIFTEYDGECIPGN